MSYANKKRKRPIRSRLVLALLLTVLTPFLSFSAELIHTIQIGSHQVEQRAVRQYEAVLKLLKEAERDDLRIENIDRYYALRLGSFATFQEAEERLQVVKSAYHDATVITAYISKNRLIKIYQPAVTAETVPVLLELKETPGPTPQVKQEEAERVQVEAPVRAPVEKKVEPRLLTEVSKEEPALAESQEPATALQELKTDPVVVSEQSTPEPAPVAAEEAVAVTPVEIKPLLTAAEVTSPVNSPIVEPKTTLKIAAAENFFSNNQLMAIAAVLGLSIVALSVRSLKAAKTAQLIKAANKAVPSAGTPEEQRVSEPEPALELVVEKTVAAEEPEAAVLLTAAKETTCLLDSCEDNNTADQSVAEIPEADSAVTEAITERLEELDSDTSAARPSPAASSPPATDGWAEAIQENMPERLVKEKRENRIGSALEAAMLTSKRKS